MDLSIITVTYQSKDYIDSCIMSVVGHTFCDYEHLIVDNGSTDGTVELIEDGYLSYVRLIKNGENLGFAAANNLALKQAKGKYILFLNPDMRLEEGRIEELMEWMDQRPDVGLVSCRLLNEDKIPTGSLRPMKYPHLLPYLFGFLKLRSFFVSIHPAFFYQSFDDEAAKEVEIVRGSFMLTKREILGEYAFDPRYFILFEDLDLCREIKKRGYKVYYVPLVSCVDFLCRSFHLQTRAWKYLQMGKSFKKYVRKWHSPFHLFWINCVIPIGFILRIKEWGMKDSWRALRGA